MALHDNCHLIAISGGKGGVGKSVFAANLAFAFLREMRAKVLLVDLDAKTCGDQNVITGLKPQKTIKDLVSYQGAINAAAAEQFIVKHPGGLHYLAATQSHEQQLSADPNIFSKQISSLSQMYQYIIVDVGHDLDDLQMSAIELASSLIVLTTPEVLVVNQTRKFLSDLSARAIPRDLMHLTLNKVDRSGLAAKAVSNSLRLPVMGSVPKDDALVQSSLQRSTPFVLSTPNSPVTAGYHALVRTLTGGVLQKMKSAARPKVKKPAVDSAATANSGAVALEGAPGTETMNLLKTQIHSELIKEMDLKKDLTKTKGDPDKERQLKQKTMQTISQLTDRMGQGLSRDERSRVIKEVLDEALGLGPLEALLEDSKVTEIMVNGYKHIYVERSGKLTLSPVTFTSNLQLRNVIERIVTPIGRRIDEKLPYVDARLADGSRVNAVIEPLAIDGPSLTIRKFPEDRITVEDYVDRFKSLTQPMADFLKICVEQGLNIIISGGTGSGKTTLLNVMSGFIPTNERIITVEDAAELQLKQEHVVRLETRPANMEGSGEVSIRDLIKNSLRMRPDRIVVGECRDGAALDMLAAMNTGHDGSMTTVHSNSPREGISRLETLCMMAGMDLPAKAIREQIAGAVNLIVQIGRLSDGSRKIKSITEVVGIQGDTVTLQEIFRYKEEGFDKNRKIVGQFQSMGLIPTFIEKFEQRGVKIPRGLFSNASTSPEAAKPKVATPANAEDSKAPQTLKPKAKPKMQRPKLGIKKASGED